VSKTKTYIKKHIKNILEKKEDRWVGVKEGLQGGRTTTTTIVVSTI